MKFFVLAAAVLSISAVSRADMGDAQDLSEVYNVQRSHVAGPQRSVGYGGQTASSATYCADRPERCAYGPVRKEKAPKARLYTVPTPAGCSNAGDQTSRPVYAVKNGKTVLVGFECIQDNRGN